MLNNIQKCLSQLLSYSCVLVTDSTCPREPTALSGNRYQQMTSPDLLGCASPRMENYTLMLYLTEVLKNKKRRKEFGDFSHKKAGVERTSQAGRWMQDDKRLPGQLEATYHLFIEFLPFQLYSWLWSRIFATLIPEFQHPPQIQATSFVLQPRNSKKSKSARDWYHRTLCINEIISHSLSGAEQIGYKLSARTHWHLGTKNQAEIS